MEAMFRSLNRGYEMFFADMDPERISPVIPINRKFSIPAALDPLFTSAVVDLCKKLDIDLLVPGVDEELLKIWDASEELPTTKLFMPKASFVTAMNDKLKMNRLFMRYGLDVPRAVQADETTTGLTFPVVVKPRVGRGSRDIFIIDQPHKLSPMLDALNGPIENWMVQERVDGKEYTVQVVCGADSSVLVVLPILALEKRGSTTVAEIADDPEIKEYCKLINRCFSPQGTYNVQLIKSGDGRIRCFEVNPRISTTFCMAIKAGFDPFRSFCEGKPFFETAKKPPPIRLVRHWINEFSEE